MTMEDFIQELLRGRLDSHLDSLQDAINARNKSLRHNRAVMAQLTIRKGDQVILVNVSPKKAAGITCRVSRVDEDGRIHVILPYTITSRLYGGKEVSWPNSCYEKLESFDSYAYESDTEVLELEEGEVE